MPEVRYALSGTTRIAYQVWGEGERTMVGFPSIVTCCELCWEEPHYQRWFEQIGRFCRFVMFDKRGCGLSDPTDCAPTLEERVDDARAVLDAVGAEQAVVWGASEGGSLAVLFALLHPERTEGLLLCQT